MMADGLSAARLTELARQPTSAALPSLAAAGLLTSAAAAEAARLALAAAPADPAAVAAWLPLLHAWTAATGADPATTALLFYVESRLALEQGDFTAAERALQAARDRWQQAGDELSLARSGLGLTQLLAMQGRFDAAEASITAAIGTLGALAAQGDGDAQLLHLDAQQNLGTLLSYQERHAEALAVCTNVRAAYLMLLMQATDPDTAADLQIRLGLVERDAALAHTYLDQPDAAETLLLAAVERLGLPAAQGERGQARTNLAHLYNRTGRYAQALALLDAATLDLLGTLDVDSVPARWPAAGELFLEQAALYLALNLLPEAETALRRAQETLRTTQQQYELGQALYYQGLLHWQRNDAPAAEAALAEAEAIYTALDNAYWLHRVHLAQAAVSLRSGDLNAAAQRIAALLDAQADATAETDTGAATALAFDMAGSTELHLLAARLYLAQGDAGRAGRAVQDAAASLGLSAPDADEPTLPYLHIHLLHVAGLAARMAGDAEEARRLLTRAVELVEAQRGLLPIAELRAAFLGDKTAIYADLIVSLLDMPGDQPANAAAVAAAFALVERARSRSLLERLLSAVDDVQATAGLPRHVREQIIETRNRLSWLYNQLLGPGAGGSRQVMPALSAELRAREAALQRLEWQRSELLQEAQPITLAELQAQLDPDQAALAYFIAGEEVLAFLVTAGAGCVQRNLARASELEAAQAQWRFQLGRVEIGGGYAERHQARLLEGARAALHRLYDLLVAPLLPALAELQAGAPDVRRLLVVPFGPLHLVPFHALWDGERYLLATYEIAYAASASLLVHHKAGQDKARRRPPGGQPLQTLAALALPDPAIPQAETEVRAAARYFPRTRLFLNEQAGSDGLHAAAETGDVLHIATHGVFRPDNPFFSALKLADGWIDVRAIYRLPLAARLVVLSACESGAVQVQGSDEAIGLGRGFLGAGARSLVVSLWNVHDASAAILMEQFYAQLAGDGRGTARALRAAQQQAAAAGRHPYYWAPYLVMGDL